MARRTVNLPESVDALVRSLARDGESFSATITRLIEETARVRQASGQSAWCGSFDGPEDLGLNAERYLRELVELR